jgi:hypothetical protein
LADAVPPGERPDAGRTERERLFKLLHDIYSAIRHRQFDRDQCKSVTDQIINVYFKKSFSYYHKDIVDKNLLHYIRSTALRTRVTFAAICEVARHVFSDEPTSHEVITRIRDELQVQDSKFHDRQRRILEAIESELSKIYSRPRGPITFVGSENQSYPAFKVDHKFFPDAGAIELYKQFVIGRFSAYRRLLAPERDLEYIREPVSIDDTPDGIVFSTRTKIRVAENREDVIRGVLLFAQEAFWLFGYYTVPFNRLRVLAASIADWQQYKESRKPYCTATLMTHVSHVIKKDGVEHTEKIPHTRIVLFKKESDSSDRAEKVLFFNKETIHKHLTRDEIALLRAPGQ